MNQPLPPTRLPHRHKASELLRFVLDNKKWWLTPIVLLILLLLGIALLSSTGVAPLMYTQF